MKQGTDSKRQLQQEVEQLRRRLEEAEETLRAIRSGEVDAVVVAGPGGEQIYTLESEERPYRLLVEEMQQGAIKVGADGTILYCNRCLADMLGMSRQVLVSSSIFNFVAEWDRPAFESLLRSGMHEVTRDEFTLFHADGRRVPVYVCANPLPRHDVPSLCLVLSDLTTQKQQELMRLAKEASDEANRAKDQFLAALSHELRTPLTPVLLSVSELLKHAELSPEVRDELEMIRRNIDLEARLIDDLLDLTRISRGKMELNLRPTDAHRMLHNALAICQPDIDTKRQDVVLELNARRCHVNGDPARLHQIYWNLIKNAVKFTPAGGRIILRTFCNEHNELMVQVIDSGIGIEPEALPRLFNAFEQGDPSITRRFGGLGMGLSISKALVDMHGGRIFASSPGKNEGATFTVSMPTVDAAPLAETGAKKPHLGHTVPLRILLVEDHPDTARSMSRLLRELGHTVTMANSVGEALRAIEQDDFDLLVSDVGLPDGTGHELLRTVRQKKQIPAIALSGYGMEPDLRRSLDVGFAAHLVKPIQFDQLQDTMARLLTHHHPHNAHPPSNGGNGNSMSQ